VHGIAEGRRVAVAERALFASWASMSVRASRERAGVLVAIDGAAAGVISVADPIKASTREAVQQLHADGLRLVMLTGDQRANGGRRSRRSSASTR
jgi:Cu+-exporting ATPase